MYALISVWCEGVRGSQSLGKIGSEWEGTGNERRKGGTLITPSSSPVASMCSERAMTRLMAALQSFQFVFQEASKELGEETYACASSFLLRTFPTPGSIVLNTHLSQSTSAKSSFALTAGFYLLKHYTADHL